MSTETKELNRLFNNISGGTVDLKLPQTKWLQMINEWIEENGIGGGDGSSYKGITVLMTGTYINDGSELPTTYDFMIASDSPIEGAEDYWGDGDEEKSYLLLHHLNNGEAVLTPVLLFSIPDNDSETGGYIYKIQVLGQSSPISFSSVEIPEQNTLVAHLYNELDFNFLENALKANSLIQSGSGDAITDEPIKLIAGTGMTSSGKTGGDSVSSHFRFSIFIPRSIIESDDESKLKSYLEGNKLCFWTDDANGNTYLTPFSFYTNPDKFEFASGDYLEPLQSGVSSHFGVVYFDFDGSAKELFIQNALNSGASSGGPNYQVISTVVGTVGNFPGPNNIHFQQFEVDENYMLLRVTYQEITEDYSPIETKVFSIINIDNGTYYVVWNIEQNHTIYKTTEGDPEPTDSYLEFYPNVVGFYDNAE